MKAHTCLWVASPNYPWQPAVPAATPSAMAVTRLMQATDVSRP